MSNIDTLKALFDAVGAQDWDQVDALLSDDFQIVGHGPMPENKATFIDRHKAQAAALPDYSYNAGEFNQEDREATAWVQITGTHSGTLDLPAFGVEGFAATGTEVKLPREMVIARIEGDRVASMVVHGPDSGGVTGLLNRIGATSPE